MKGALRQHSSIEGLRRVVRFALNPEYLRRDQSTLAGQRDIVETIRLVLPLHVAELDDRVEATPASGVYPWLAAIEELYATQARPPTGNLFERLFGNGPWVFLSFEWGERRVPVRIERLAVTEHRFNPELTPWHATVRLRLRVLSPREAGATPAARAMLEDYLDLRSAAARRA